MTTKLFYKEDDNQVKSELIHTTQAHQIINAKLKEIEQQLGDKWNVDFNIELNKPNEFTRTFKITAIRDKWNDNKQAFTTYHKSFQFTYILD